MHKTAILNRDENINDPSSAADFYVDPAPVKSSRRLILGGLLIAAAVSRYTLRSFKLMKSDSSLTSDLRHSQFSCSNNRYVVTEIVIDQYCQYDSLCTKSIWTFWAELSLRWTILMLLLQRRFSYIRDVDYCYVERGGGEKIWG